MKVGGEAGRLVCGWKCAPPRQPSRHSSRFVEMRHVLFWLDALDFMPEIQIKSNDLRHPFQCRAVLLVRSIGSFPVESP